MCEEGARTVSRPTRRRPTTDAGGCGGRQYSCRMTEETRRPTTVSIARTASKAFTATNARGGTISIGSGESDDFTPVELLLVAIGACSAIDVDIATTRRVEPETFDVDVNADRVKDADGNRVDNIEVDFLLRFPEGEDGDRARKLIDRAIASAHDKLCTVSRTVELGTPVAMRSVD